MTVPIYCKGQVCGQLKAESQGLYTRFTGQIELEKPGRVYADFGGRRIDLGLPTPEKDKWIVKKTVTTATLPGMALKCGITEQRELWENCSGCCIDGIRFPVCYRYKNKLRVPWAPGQKIDPMEPVLLYCYQQDGEKNYLELNLDENNRIIKVRDIDGTGKQDKTG